MAKQVAKKAENQLAETQFGFDFQKDVGAGMEGADKDSYAIPFLRVLQKMSPQCDEADSAYVEGAKPGMFFNSVTNKVYEGKEGITFLPCAFQRRFLEWAPRGAEGQGYRGELLPEDVAELQADGRVKNVEGRLYVADEEGDVSEKKSNRLSDTRSHFGLIVVEGEASQVLLALSSTQIKKSKQLMSILSSAKVTTADGAVTPPTWMNQIKMTTVQEQNDQGSWYGVRFEPNGFITSAELYAAGKSFHDAINAGEVGADFAKDQPGEEVPAGQF
jgi:hypothetical protein